MHMTLSIVIMQVTLSFIAIRWQFQETISYSVLRLTASFHKTDQKTFKSIISGLHFTTSVNILPKLRYFEGKNDLQIGYKSYSVLLFCFVLLFFNCYLAVPRPTLGHYWGTASLTQCNHCVLHFWPEGHREPRNKVGSLSPAKCLMGFEPGTLRFFLQCLNH